MDDNKEKEGAPEETKWNGGDEKIRWKNLMNILTRTSRSFVPPPFEASDENLEIIQEDFRVLVVGAGGLGCEILKNLALSGFKDIEVIDLDIIDLSNLNRQFLFRKKDIGAPKSKVAAEFVMKRVPGCKIKWYQKPLQDFEDSFFTKFNVVIAGLDNVEARRYLNAMLCDLVQKDENGQIVPDSVIPFIDGGTEGFLGQSRLFVPMMSSCFECSVGTMTPPKAFASCTIASIPRRPEHCIAYAHKMLWHRLKWLKTADDYEMVPIENKNIPDPDGVKLDTDDVQHMSWIYNRAMERAKQFKIEGVTYNLTMQVVKNIIPAIASTNALISAICVNEAFKVLTWCSYGLDNYFMYMGQDGIYSRTWRYEKNEQCPICGSEPLVYKLDGKQTTFDLLYQKICNDQQLKLANPSVVIHSNNKAIFMASKAMRSNYEDNLPKPLEQLFENETILRITDKNLGRGNARIKIFFEKDAVYIPPPKE